MLEKDFVESTKGTLMDNLLNSIDQKFDLTDQALVMSEELVSYFDGRLTVSTVEERQRFNEAFNEWQARAFNALARRPTHDILCRFITVMPEALRTAFCSAVQKELDHRADFSRQPA